MESNNRVDTNDANEHQIQQIESTKLKQPQNKKQTALIVLGILIIAIFVVVYLIKANFSSSRTEESTETSSTVKTTEPSVNPFADLDSLRSMNQTVDTTNQSLNEETGDPSLFELEENTDGNTNAQGNDVAPPSQPIDTVRLRKSSGSMVTLAGTSNNASNSEGEANMTMPEILNAQEQKLFNTMQNASGNNLTGTPTANRTSTNNYQSLESNTVKATKSRYNPNLTLPKGSFIKCSLRTKIITNIGGEAGCIITDDIYSENGNVVLVEKGSQIFGHFQTGQMRQGDSRVFIVWNEIKTPHNIKINIDSNATGSLGETGVGGWVDNHFWQRFGNAIMVSLLSDSASALTTRIQKNGAPNPAQNTQDATVSVTESIISKSIDIPPTLYKNQGDIVGVFLSKDLDFSDVYHLRLK